MKHMETRWISSADVVDMFDWLDAREPSLTYGRFTVGQAARHFERGNQLIRNDKANQQVGLDIPDHLAVLFKLTWG